MIMQNVRGLFLCAKVIQKADKSKPAQILLDVIIPSEPSEVSTGGEHRQMFIKGNVDALWGLLRVGQFGDTIELEPTITMAYGKNYVDFVPVSITPKKQVDGGK